MIKSMTRDERNAAIAEYIAVCCPDKPPLFIVNRQSDYYEYNEQDEKEFVDMLYEHLKKYYADYRDKLPLPLYINIGPSDQFYVVEDPRIIDKEKDYTL